MKKQNCFIKLLLLTIFAFMLTACNLTGANESKGKDENVQTAAYNAVVSGSGNEDIEEYDLPMPDYSTGSINEDYPEIQSGIVGEGKSEAESLDKWIVLLKADKD